MTKQEIRQNIREQFRNMTAEELQTASDPVCRKIFDRINRTSGSVSTVLAYCSLRDELCTESLISELFSSGYAVLLPVVSGNDIILKKYYGADSLKPGAFGILEPVGETFGQDRYSEIDLALIPGRAFTMDGKRLGRGKGYYDRLLPALSCPRIGVCFPFQIVDDIPCEPHDMLMDEIIF